MQSIAVEGVGMSAIVSDLTSTSPHHRALTSYVQTGIFTERAHRLRWSRVEEAVSRARDANCSASRGERSLAALAESQ